MTSDPPILRNDSAKLILISGARVQLRDVLFGEQVRLGGNRFAAEVTPMMHGRFRLVQNKGGVKAPIDITAQNCERIARRGATGGLGPMPKPRAEDAGVFEVSYMRMPFAGTMEMFLGRAAVHGTDEATGAERVVLLSDVQVMEVKRRKPPPRTRLETDDYVPAEQTAGEAAVAEAAVPDAVAADGTPTDEEPGASPNT